jgi:putative transposase
MGRRVYSEMNLHIVWHTKVSMPLITPEVETPLYDYLKTKIINTPTAFFHSVGGTENHIDLAVSVLPSLKVDEWVGHLKGGSAYYINHQIANRKVLECDSQMEMSAFN